MSLRIKLPLFIVVVVFITAVAILTVSVRQTQRRAEKNIADIRIIETSRVKNVLREQVNIIYSMIKAEHQRSMTQEDMTSILDKIKTITYDKGRGYFWISDTHDSPKILIHPYLGGLSGPDSAKILSLVSTVNRLVRTHGEGYYELTWPRLDEKGFSDSSFSKLCFARLYTPLGWVVASGRYTDDIDDVIHHRITQTREEIDVIIRDRIFFAFAVLFVSTVAIFVFTGLITGPINKLVTLTEQISSGTKGFTERITLRSRDEIGRLARSFNAMLGHIQTTMDKLEENGRKYRELVENANSAIIRIDRQGKILFFNEYAQRMFGFSAAEIQGKNITNIVSVSPDVPNPKAHSILYDVLLSPGAYIYNEEQVQTKTNEKKWVAWTTRPIYDNAGVLMEILCVGSDVTARKKAEELAQQQQRTLIQTDKMATLGILVSGVAHEINNPNNFIILNGENLSEMWKDVMPVLDEYYASHPTYTLGGLPYKEMREELPGLLNGINQGARRIKRIVETLKDFSRQESGDLNQKIRLKDVVENASVILGNMIKTATKRFEVIEEGQIPEVTGNFQRLEQVVINLITNACEASKDHEKPITVTISYDDMKNRVSLSIHDEGQGIPPEHLKYIMDPFFTTKRDRGGTGLGLAISYSIVKDHGGDLRIKSAQNRGTTATILLPIT
ncbi:MAG TPA: ATP-binding protein [Chitinivibrionales bacterium]|nr:ATP-binding protein [Chitinivibrionales bacterium]